MRHIYARSFFSSLILLSAVSATAQKSNDQNSPYSRYGIGEMRNGVNTMLKGMGSVSTAYRSNFNVNTDNPASYSSLTLTAYEGGAEGSVNTVFSGNDKYKTGMATISYMTVGIPLGTHAGMALGFRPFSRVYYVLNDTSLIDTFGQAIRSYQGDGALNQGFIGFGGKLKGVSLGFNFGYIFGSVENTSHLLPLDANNNVLGSLFYKRTRMGGIYWNAGAMYEHNISKKLGIRAGATLALSQDLKGTRDEYWIGLRYEQDTIYRSVGNKGNITIPMKYSAGIQLVGTDNWNVAIDYSAANWAEYRNFGLTDSIASGTYRMAVGGEFTPDPASTRKYLNRVTYRLGGYYGTDPVMLHNTQLDYYAVTAGLTFPFRKNVARVHTSIEVGSRGTKTNGLIRENFVKFGVGLSFNDKWFIKRKYD